MALTGKFAFDLFTFLERWGEWAAEAVDAWPERRADRDRWAREVIRDIAESAVDVGIDA